MVEVYICITGAGMTELTECRKKQDMALKQNFVNCGQNVVARLFNELKNNFRMMTYTRKKS